MSTPLIFIFQIRLLCLFLLMYIGLFFKVETGKFDTFEDVSIENVPFLASVRKIRLDSVAIGIDCAATITKNRVLFTAAMYMYIWVGRVE